jgi:hypothetical protein
MIVDVLIGGTIFGLALWFLVRAIRISRKGKCAGCALREKCGKPCCAPMEERAEAAERGPRR